MDVSVIIPTYKPAAYVYECLDSLVAQTFPFERFEVILVLNGCKEPYEADLKKYIHEKMDAMNVFLIQTDVPGVSNARNLGLDKAKGEYICFIDDDDYVSPVYLEELYKKASPETVALSNVLAFYDNENSGSFLNVADNYSIRKEYIACSKAGRQRFWKARKYFSGPCMKMIHRSVIGSRRYDEKYKNGEDSLFMFAISDRIKYVDFTSEGAVYYRRFRRGSAAYKPLPFKNVAINVFSMMIDYSKMYLRAPFVYNTMFYVTRMLACLHHLLWYVKHYRFLKA